MFRAILYLIVFIVAVSVIRSVMGIIGKLFGAMMSPQAPPVSNTQSGRAATPSPTMESLHKDPVCGTFVAPSTAWQKVSGGKTYYFCSTQCRDQFKS
ncbi:MAG TPA: YHS domain-containing protein [Bryobacteraceae bacterium]|nr:YHS domain-containing protein [Bryobacteraceae bacterium]